MIFTRAGANLMWQVFALVAFTRIHLDLQVFCCSFGISMANCRASLLRRSLSGLSILGFKNNKTKTSGRVLVSNAVSVPIDSIILHLLPFLGLPKKQYGLLFGQIWNKGNSDYFQYSPYLSCLIAIN